MPSRRKSTPCKILNTTAHQPVATTTASESSSSNNNNVTSTASNSPETENHSHTEEPSESSLSPSPELMMEHELVVKVQPESPGECSRRVQEEDGGPVGGATTNGEGTKGRHAWWWQSEKRRGDG